MQETKSNFAPLITNLKPHLKPNGPLISLTLLGSYADQSLTNNSDLDLLFIVDNEVTALNFVSIGKSLRSGLSKCFPNRNLFIFDSPSLDRPDITPSDSIRVHLLVHKIDWVQESLRIKNWVFTCWSNKHETILGEDVLNPPLKPELNASLIDEFDGLPSIERRIEYALLSSDLNQCEAYFKKLASYAFARYSEIISTFPELKSTELSEIKKHKQGSKEYLFAVYHALQCLTEAIRSKLYNN
jgi:predicted nucleotidyltransferase